MVMTVRITAKKKPQEETPRHEARNTIRDLEALPADLFTIVPAWEIMPMSAPPVPASAQKKKPAPANDREDGAKSGFYMIDMVNGQ